jgi:hypothetical protein
LKDIATSNRDPWLLAGDFNDILGANEKKGGAPICLRKCLKFKERIDACQLMDLGAIGSKFTWRGPTYHGGQHIFERLDRALSNDSRWLEFPDGVVRVLPRLDFSDHHPLLICPMEVPHQTTNKQFHFESAWFLDNSYYDMLKENWKQQNSIVNNMQNVQHGITDWKLMLFDEVRRKKK